MLWSFFHRPVCFYWFSGRLSFVKEDAAMKKEEEKRLRRLAASAAEEAGEEEISAPAPQSALAGDGSVTTRCDGKTIHCLTAVSYTHLTLPTIA